MADAYSAIMRSRVANRLLWRGVRDLLAGIRRTYEEAGLQMAPAFWDAFWARIDRLLPANSEAANDHARYVSALQTDYGPRLTQHIIYRLAHQGNVHIRVVGPTGSGKSSCVIYLIDWIKAIPTGKLAERIAVDIHDLPRILTLIEAGDTAFLDELFATSGEGARTNLMLLDNLDDTIRESQKNLVVATPKKGEQATMHMLFECIAWNPEKRFSVFLVWVEGIPLGVLAIPWCSAAQRAEYKPVKGRSLERSLAGQFNDADRTGKSVMELFDEPRVLKLLDLGSNKPTMKELNSLAVRYLPGMATIAQIERIAHSAYFQLSMVQRLQDNYGKDDKFTEEFEALFGAKPTPAFLKIAQKFYEEHG